MFFCLPYFFPLLVLLPTLHDDIAVHLENNPEDVRYLIPYGISCVAAAILARVFRFRDYRLSGITNAYDAFLGCLFCWPCCFPWFLYTLWNVLTGRAEPGKAEKARLDAALGVLAFLFCSYFLSCILLPSILQSPLRANEAAAANALKQYAAAQNALKQAGAREYCDNYRNLYYDPAVAKASGGHVPKKMADAFASSRPNSPTAGQPAADPAPSHGYVFFEDPYISGQALWPETFGLIAYPAKPWRTGRHVFWIGGEGNVFFWEIPKDTEHLELFAPEASPRHPQRDKQWLNL